MSKKPSKTTHVQKYVRPHTAIQHNQTQPPQTTDSDTTQSQRPKTAAAKLKQRKCLKVTSQHLTKNTPNKLISLEDLNSDSGYHNSVDDIENVARDEESFSSFITTTTSAPLSPGPSEGFGSLVGSQISRNVSRSECLLPRTSRSRALEEGEESNNALDRSRLISCRKDTRELRELAPAMIIQGESEFDVSNEKERALYKLRYQDIAGASTKLPLSLIGKCRRVRRAKTAWKDTYAEEERQQLINHLFKDKLFTQNRWQKLMLEVRLRAIDSPNTMMSANDADSDLEDPPVVHEGDSFDGSGVAMYRKECRKRDVVPVSYLLRHLGDRSICMNHHYMNANTVKTIATALTVNTITEQIDFSDNFMETAGIKHISEMLTINNFIVDLDVSNNNIQSEGVVAIADMLMYNRSLKSLNLSGNKLVCRDMVTLLNAFKYPVSVEALDLCNNDIGDIGGQLLASLLMISDCLHNLDLSWNNIRRKGAILLMSALSKNHKLEILDLSWNGIGSCGADALGKSLKVNEGLKVIDISHNNIGDEDADKIASGIKKNVSLHTVIISQNNLGEKGCLALLKACESHTKLTVLGMEEMKLTIAVLEKIREIEGEKLFVLNSGLNEYRCYSPEVGMCHLMSKIMKWKRDQLQSIIEGFDRNNRDLVNREQLCASIINCGVLLTNKLTRTLMGEIDYQISNRIHYKDLFAKKQPKHCAFSLRLKHLLFPPSSFPVRKLAKALTFG